ncbi:MAG: hypothetical protein H6980_06755 [Gammaproteobacteria bacterium]|nr:hypothetical protein [Gammaproteobacteria bacterium]
MNAFLERYRGLLVSSLFVVIAIIALGYAKNYRVLQQTIDALARERAALVEDNERLSLRLKVVKETKESTPTAGVQTMPVFLSRINNIANTTQVILRELVPDKENRYKFHLELHTDYFTFLRFMADLESLNTVINDLEVRPYDATQVPPVHVIRFSITPRNDAEPLDSERLRLLKQQVQKRDKRNPFQRFAFDHSRTQPKPVIDLTWIHLLTGIGKEDGRYYATIDRRDYYVGSVIEDRRVTRIEADRIYMTRETRDGTQEYVLRFREKKGK